MARVIALCLVILCVLTAVLGDCYTRPLYRRWKDGQLERYCQTKEVKPMVIRYGQRNQRTKDCYSCSCDYRGLLCCGFGVKSGNNADHIPVPHGCMLVVEGCDFYFINAITHARC